jgi:biotin carboxylase
MDKPTFLAIASYYKGIPLLRACHDLGIHTILLTCENLRDKDWPWECIDEKFFMPNLYKQPDVTHAVSYLAREHHIDRIIPLDDFDVETAAALREHLRCPGMGDTTARYFRDKLAMRVQARDCGIRVPDFVGILNYAQVDEYTRSVPAPWVLKPRSEAGSVGIKKVHNKEQLWELIHALGDRQSYYLAEKYVRGDVFHVDAVVFDNKVQFARAHRYGVPPFDVWNHGGVFSSKSLPSNGKLGKSLLELNEKMVDAMRLVRGVTHTEFIQGEDGELYFLEMAARVGGANIDKLIKAGSGIDLWREWARLELADMHKEPYRCPKPEKKHAGLLVCLSRDASPDLSSFDAPEVIWKEGKEHHAAILLSADSDERVEQLIAEYKSKLQGEVLAVAPPTEKVVH